MGDELSRFLDLIVSSSERSSEKSKLCRPVKLGKIDDSELRAMLKALYSGRTECKLVASVINASFSEQKAAFLFSKKIFENIIKCDPNIRRKSLNGTEYKSVWGFLIGNGFASIVKERVGREATLLELANPDLVAAFDRIVGSEIRMAQKQKALRDLASYSNKLPEALPSDPTADYEPEAEGDVNDDFENEKDFSCNVESDCFGTTTKIPSPRDLKDITKKLLFGDTLGDKPIDSVALYKRMSAIDKFHKRALSEGFPLECRYHLIYLFGVIKNDNCDDNAKVFFMEWYERQFHARLPLSAARFRELQAQEEEFYAQYDDQEDSSEGDEHDWLGK